MLELFAVKHCYLIPLLPLLGAIISGFFGAKWLKGQSHWPIWIGVGASACLAISLLIGTLGIARQNEKSDDSKASLTAKDLATRNAEAATSGESESFPLARTKKWFDWILAGGTEAGHKSYSGSDITTADGTSHLMRPFYVEAGAWIDPLSVVMLCVVCGIGFFITVFAAGYMKGEAGYFRFFAYLGLFIFSMTCLVMGNNFVMLYLGWEGVGLCSYLLIGYYFERPAAREAAKKAFPDCVDETGAEKGEGEQPGQQDGCGAAEQSHGFAPVCFQMSWRVRAAAGQDAFRPTCKQADLHAGPICTQAKSSAALAARMTAAVAPWMPKAVAREPPFKRTIAASPMGIVLAAAMKAPSRCGAWFATRMKMKSPDAISRTPLT